MTPASLRLACTTLYLPFQRYMLSVLHVMLKVLNAASQRDALQLIVAPGHDSRLAVQYICGA